MSVIIVFVQLKFVYINRDVDKAESGSGMDKTLSIFPRPTATWIHLTNQDRQRRHLYS